MMKHKKLWLIPVGIVAVLVLGLALAVGVSYHRIAILEGKDLVRSCPKRAQAGEQITVYTAEVDDGQVYITGVEGDFVSPGVYVFPMPDEPVELRVKVQAPDYGE